MKVQKLFQKTLFGVFAVFGCIGLSTSILTIYTVDTHLTDEYVSNASNIAKTIADSSVDILLNRNLTSLQSLIDQFVAIQGIKSIYVTDETGVFVAHTFVPGVPKVIQEYDFKEMTPVLRNLEDMGDLSGDYIEVGSPILAGVAGTVHVGMDTTLIALKIQRAIGNQVYLISIIFIVGALAAIWLVNLAAKPMGGLLAYSVDVARAAGHDDQDQDSSKVRELSDGDRDKLLERRDEVGHLARLFSYIADVANERRSMPVARTGETR